MKYGLTDKELNQLLDIVVNPLKQLGAKVFIFGSRANGKFTKFSDIDICYVSNPEKNIPGHQIHSLIMNFENSTFPYEMDLVNLDELASSYRDSVDQDKIEF